MQHPDPTEACVHRLLMKLESIVTLSDEDKEALTRLPMTLATVEVDQDIIREGDRPAACCLLLDGFVCRYRLLAQGERQIMSFHVPGDIVDLQSLHLQVMDHSIAAIVPSRVGFLAHQAVHDLIRQHPRLGAAFWRDTLIDAAIFREWLVGIGRRTSYGRIAHLFCEVVVKLKAVGLGDDQAFVWPITQVELADALGLTPVHAKRVLQQLQADHLIRLQDRTVTVLDWQGLMSAGGFDPAYLHQDQAA